MLDKIFEYFVNRKNAGFDRGESRQHTTETPVISIGNLSAGGAGKTPLIILCSQLLKLNEISLGVVGHGYKRKSKKPILIDRGDISLDLAGDEAALIHKLTGNDVFVSSSKLESARTLSSMQKYNALLLDDGFQHRRLSRSLDIVIVDKSTIRNPFLMPKGRLREPLSSIGRADVVVFRDITKIPDIFEKYITTQKVFFVSSVLSPPVQLKNWCNSGKTVPEAELHHSTYSNDDKWLIPMSGLAKNSNFHKSLKAYGYRYRRTIEFGDHYNYKPSDVDSAISMGRSDNIPHIAITEKDAIKIAHFSDELTDIGKIYVHPMRFEINQPDELVDLMLDAIN